MDIVTLGAALNGSAEYVNSHFKGGSNIQIVDNPDGTQTINASGEVSAEDTVARADIAAIKDGANIDSFGDVETALATKADSSTTYTKTEVDTALDGKADTTDIPTVPITAIQKNGTGIAPVSGTVNITVPTSAADVSALPDSTKYAGAATAGGSATSAAKLDTASAGSVTQPVYFTNGVPTPTTYSLEKSVPSNAVFTDTTYSNMSQSEATTGTATNGRLISAKVLGDTIDEKIAKLGYSIETVTFSSLPTGTSWVKTSGGLFYTSPTIDVSGKFDVIYAATLNDFGNIQGNIVVTPYIKPGTAKFGLWVVDPTNPQDLPMISSTNVKVALFGVLKAT